MKIKNLLLMILLIIFFLSNKSNAQQWSSFGNGLEYPVNSLVFHNGNLYAASYGVYLWDGSKWTDMSNGMRALFGSGDVYALANFNNVLFAGGNFTVFTPDGNWYNNVARFSNGSWTTCGSGTGNDGSGMSNYVNYLIEYNGQLYAGGRFGSAGGDPLYPRDAAYIARFDGAEWHSVGGGMDYTVADMVVYNGDLIASGYFTRAAYLNSAGEENPGSISANYIAKWNGVNWSPLGSGMDGKVTALAVHNGELYAGGLFENAGGMPAKNIAKWNGQSWSPVGNGIAGGGQVYTLASYNNELYAGGEFTTVGGNAGNYIMRWDGSQWKSVGSGTNGPVIALLADSSGLYVGGSFTMAGNIAANNIAKWCFSDGMFDFNGDGKTDVAAFHLPTDQFFTDYAGNLGQFGWGGSDSMPLIWDYDGDGATEVSIYHIPTNQWFVKGYPGDNLGQFGWGGSDSVPVPGDYNGDGVMERAFYHSPTNRWFVEGQDPVQFGWNGAECIPVPGDYDGDGKTDMALYHIPSNQWFLYGVGNLGQFGWGGADCIPVVGDYNGDGKTEIAIYHVPSNQWFWRDEGGTAHFLGQYGWGGLESFPIPGDYDGDGVMERGFYRPSNNRWFIEGESDFVWGWDGGNFIPITSQIAVYNWFRFKLGRFH